MKKFVSLLLVLMFSFGMVSTVRQEKVEAASIALGYAVFKAGIAFTGFATYAGWLYANGYTQPVQEMIVGYANKYYDYANGVYTAKVDKMNIIDKLNLYTSSLITGNLGNIPTYDEINAIKNDIVTSYKPRIDISTIQHDFVLNAQNSSSAMTIFSYADLNQGFREIKPEYVGKIIKIVHSSYPDYFYYIRMANLGYEKSIQYNEYFPKVNFIMPNGEVFTHSFHKNYMFNVDTIKQIFNIVLTGGVVANSYIYNVFRNNYINVGDPVITYETLPNSYATGDREWIYSAPNYYPALNGLASNTQDLENLMNTDEYLQREISRLLEQQQVNEENEVYTPSIGADGMITYPGTETIPDNPDIPYNPGQTWYENLFNKVGAIPDLFIGGITDLWDNTLVPKLDNIRDSILDIPTKLDLIWEWIIDFPDLIYDFFVPSIPAISETWQPVTDLFNQKIFPVIQPFQNIGFYEEELQDISADIKIGQYQGNHKIIDYSYLKSVREPIKSVIRSFFWILIIFFNLDQVHRLIRNQSIVKTYIRKVDEPGGNK